MKKDTYSWETRFLTSEGIIIHTFSERVKVATDMRSGIIKVIKDDKVIITRKDIDICSYERFLSNISQDVNHISF